MSSEYEFSGDSDDASSFSSEVMPTTKRRLTDVDDDDIVKKEGRKRDNPGSRFSVESEDLWARSR